jgi:hypothetical protein
VHKLTLQPKTRQACLIVAIGVDSHSSMHIDPAWEEVFAARERIGATFAIK